MIVYRDTEGDTDPKWKKVLGDGESIENKSGYRESAETDSSAREKQQDE